MQYLYIFLSVIVGYLFGSLPTALIFGKVLKGIDIRDYGSKNLGATNAGRILGKKYFYIVTVIDATKCIVSILINMLIFHLFFKNFREYYTICVALSGTFAMVGHCFPIFAKFKGGKGVATAIGYALITNPLSALFALLVFIFFVKVKKVVSLGSIFGALAVVIYNWVIYFIFGSRYNLMWLNLDLNIYYCIITTILALCIIVRHKDNIIRLINHSENKA